MNLNQYITEALCIKQLNCDNEAMFIIRVMDRVRIISMTWPQFRHLSKCPIEFTLDFMFTATLVDDVVFKLMKYLRQTHKATTQSAWIDVMDDGDVSLFWINALNLSRALEGEGEVADRVLVINCDGLSVPIYIGSPQYDDDDIRLDVDTLHMETDSAIPILIKPSRRKVTDASVALSYEIDRKMFPDRHSTQDHLPSHEDETVECQHGVDAMMGAQCPDCAEIEYSFGMEY